MIDINNQLKLTIIYDNRKANENLQNGFGFSCLIEWKNKIILFDTDGDSAAFFTNIKKLNIKLDNITYLIFSHQHWDHTAGFADIINQISAGAQIFLPTVFADSLLKNIPDNKVIYRNEGFKEIDKDIYSLVLKGRTSVIKECFSLYEQSLIFNTVKGLFVLTGCGHPGIVNILKQTKNSLTERPLYLVAGGFHLHRSFSWQRTKIINAFRKFDVRKVAPCHCSGDKMIAQFKKTYADDCYQLGTGTVLTI